MIKFLQSRSKTLFVTSCINVIYMFYFILLTTTLDYSTSINITSVGYQILQILMLPSVICISATAVISVFSLITKKNWMLIINIIFSIIGTVLNPVFIIILLPYCILNIIASILQMKINKNKNYESKISEKQLLMIYILILLVLIFTLILAFTFGVDIVEIFRVLLFEKIIKL